MSHFVLEIGTEELPARFQAPLEKELTERFTQALNEADLAFTSLELAMTPRRAVLHAHGLAAAQPVREETALGPSAKAAFDDQGQPTKAALGFAKSQGVDVADLFRQETEKGVYLAARRTVGGKSAMDVLQELAPALIAALPFPKRMRWGDGDFAFARPIRWILALLDGDIVPFCVGTAESGRQTWGHRVHGPGPFGVPHADALDKTLREKCRVEPAASARRAHILAQGSQAAGSGRILWKESLLDEVQGLVEHPVPMLGDFDPAFLELPREVLLTSMETHQKSFGVEGPDGALLPHFLTVLNLEPEDVAVVKQGWEKVLRARLEDARFYWKTDLKTGFPAWQERLDHVIFLGPLGSMGDKCRRLADLCAWLAEHPGIAGKTSVSSVLAAQAGRLAKADLVSQMVGEFDTLQGIMGGIYARHMGLDRVVADALADQYLPAGPDSPLPATDAGALLSLADKADTLAGCFGLGHIPTGAADPYALRRAALGIARILLEKGWRLPVDELFRKAWSLYRVDIAWKLPMDEALGKLDDFFAARLKNHFTNQYDTLLVEAALNAGHRDVWGAARRLQALETQSREPDFAAAAQTFKRVANILRKQTEPLTGAWRADLFEADVETALAEALDSLGARFDALWQADAYGDILTLLGAIRPAVDAFFEGVMVMADNADVRNNRLNLLRALFERMGKLADFSALQW